MWFLGVGHNREGGQFMIGRVLQSGVGPSFAE